MFSSVNTGALAWNCIKHSRVMVGTATLRDGIEYYLCINWADFRNTACTKIQKLLCTYDQHLIHSDEVLPVHFVVPNLV